MQADPLPKEAPARQEAEASDDPLRHFRNWHGFLLAAMAVNGLFVWGMLGQVSDPATATWHKALVWLPFNCLATVVYYVILVKLGQPGAWGLFYKLLCGGLIAGNWLLMLSA